MEVSATGRDVVASCSQNRLVFSNRKKLRELLAIDGATWAQFDIKIGKGLTGKIKKGIGGDGGLVIKQNDQLRTSFHECHFFVSNRREIECGIAIAEIEDDRLITLRLRYFQSARLSKIGNLNLGCVLDNNAFVHAQPPTQNT